MALSALRCPSLLAWRLLDAAAVCDDFVPPVWLPRLALSRFLVAAAWWAWGESRANGGVARFTQQQGSAATTSQTMLQKKSDTGDALAVDSRLQDCDPGPSRETPVPSPQTCPWIETF